MIRPLVLDDFAALRNSAPCLWQADESVDLFLTADWFELLARSGLSSPSRLQLLLLAADDEADPLCLPLLAPPGGGITGLSNFYTCLFGFVGMREDWARPSESALQALGAALRALPRSDVLTLQPLAREHAFIADMAEALRRQRYWVDRFFCFGNWYLPSSELRFDDYLASRSSQLRNNLARGRRRLSRAGSWQVELCGDDGPDLPQLQAAFEAVYADSWKQAEARPEFIAQLIQLAARRRWLRLGVLRLNGEAIAAQLWLVKAGRASIYKLAYRSGYESFSAGSILTAALMRQVLDVDRVAEVDYLSGDDAYKREWMSQRRERWGLVAFDPRRLGGLLGAARHFGGRLMRSLR